MPVIAAALAVRNRRLLTLQCLGSLRRQVPPSWDFRAFVLDDASADGTREALQRHSDVVVIEGDGERFWSGGMHLSTKMAANSRPDFLLLINDDVILDEDALDRLLSLVPQHPGAIIVGSMRDATGRATYGGIRRGHHFRLELVPPSAHPERLDSFHGNLVLVPQQVFEKLGPIDASFIHNYGDLDYGLRAGSAGIEMWLAPGTHGICELNPVEGTFLDPRLPRRKRWRLFTSDKGRPFRAHARFLRRHVGTSWPLHFFGTYLKFGGRVLVRR